VTDAGSGLGRRRRDAGAVRGHRGRGRRPCGRRRGRRWCVLAVVWLALAVAPPAAAVDGEIELTPGVQQSLQHLQEQWIQWLAALSAGDEETAESLVDDLLTTTRQLGMSTLPDLSQAAVVRAVMVARSGDFARARTALAAAERLHPGRPETAFARATVQRLEGRWVAAAGNAAVGYLRLLGSPLERRLWIANLLLAALCALLLAGALFIALEMTVSGRRLYRDLASLLHRGIPAWAVPPAVVALLLWPLALPAGLAWLVLYWSVLLWTYGSTSERTVLALVWLAAGLTPLLVAQVRDRAALELAPPVRAMDSLVEGHLYGSLFSDLGVLPGLLPDEPAVTHLLADLHRRLGQWDQARSDYRQVLVDEPDNAAARIDLGAYYFYKGDYGNAIQLFREASKEPSPHQARAFFNLSQAYSVSYLFDESGTALEDARRYDAPQVQRWMEATGEGSVLAADGGLARVPEIRRRFAAEMDGDGAGGRRLEMLRQGWSLLVVLAFAVAAGAFHVMRRRLGDGGPAGGTLAGRWTRVLVPGLASVEDGHGAAALAALLLPVALLFLPLASRFGFDLPVSYASGALPPATAVGLLLLFALRFWWVTAREP